MHYTKPFSLLALLLAMSGHSAATTYYIDYAGGNNSADGLSPQTPWKQSPGDKLADGNPASTELIPGDKIHFKGGVTYFGEIEIENSGSEGEPITLDGNTDGSYGDGRAILDGARMITGWKPVPSAATVSGNPRWQEIMYVDLDIDLSSNFGSNGFVLHRDAKEKTKAPWQRVFLIDGERRVLPIAQSPKPTDPFYPDKTSHFKESTTRIANSYPHQIDYEEGTTGKSALPLLAITYYEKGTAPVIEPVHGGAFSVEMDEPAAITEVGFTLYRPNPKTVSIEEIAFLADNVEIYVAKLDPADTSMQHFKLPHSVEARKLTFQLRHSDPNARTWVKLQQVAAFTKDGTNVLEHEVSSIIEDQAQFTQTDANWYDDMFIGVLGGNNHVYFSKIQSFDPTKHQLHVPYFKSRTYDTTRYSLYNSPKFMSLPGEWCLQPLEGGHTRVFFLPEHLKNGQPINIGYPELKTAIRLKGNASHINVKGFLIQRYAGGNGGVATTGNGNQGPSHIHIADCEIRFISGQSGISLNHSEDVTVENCTIHHCPGWTVGIYVNRINRYQLIGNHLEKNSGSGIRHYESKNGILKGNYVINHYGMHSSGLNFYEGCSDILFEGNYVQNVIAINRSAKNITFRNNVIDSQHRNMVNVALWRTGKVGDKSIKNLIFENNTFVNTKPEGSYATSIFVQSRASLPEGLVIRNNVLDRLRPPNPANIENNIFMVETDPSVAGDGSLLVEDPELLFIDPANGDYRRKPGGPMMTAGANVPAPRP
jgi:parallel beta-helix repeat protein